MTVFNLGSINVDRFYRVPHLPEPGETLPATAHEVGLGGKGANQSVAVARAGSPVRHIGMIGQDNSWVLDRLAGFGVDVAHIGRGAGHTGHAIINVDDAGENAIVTFAGANYHQSPEAIAAALAEASAGDIFMFQNEVSDKPLAARIAREKGLFVVYSAAPFKPEVVEELMPFVDLLVLNEIEAGQLSQTLGLPVEQIPVPNLLITRGAEGATWRDQATGEAVAVPAFRVDPVDTTGAGDCFIGYTIAGLDQGLGRAEALRLGAAASAVKVTRKGTADAIPSRADVDAFLAGTETK
ncbi:ribokinase [Sinisalibacter aestuarii]|uniref:Ribokinase n=1 Tax=Sinisalibacter aestuarii TaxID=2949426 RepID=A0ABQ5LN79_9RHOB|nr:ribokinase [Sinisalibacter aestuarii]GKY86464.1 ribokinase [Sinisalibacter aestuarii]